MRKLILTALLLIPFAAGCERSTSLLDRIPAGSDVTVTTKAGQAVSGRLAETRADAVVVRPAAGAPVTVRRSDIATVTISAGEPAATSAQAVPAPPPDASQPAPGQPAATGFAGSQEARAPGAGSGQVNGAPAPTAGGEQAAAPEGERTSGSAPSRPAEREVTLPAGTLLPIRLDESLASDSSRVEEPVRATLLSDVRAGGVTAVPAGSTVTGAVTEAKRSGRVKGVAQLAVRFDTVVPKGSGERYRVRTGLVARRARTTHKKDALEIGAPAAGGAILGGLLGGKKGALVGTTVGGGAGTAVVLSTRGQEVRLPRGTRLSIKLLEPVTVRVPA